MIVWLSVILFLCGVSMLVALIVFGDRLTAKSEGELLVLTVVSLIASLLLLWAEIIKEVEEA